MSPRARPGAPPAGTAWYDVVRMDPVFGPSTERIDRFQAKTRADADRIAREKHGPHVLVTLATNARRTEPRRRAKDLGNTRSPRRTR